MHSYTTIEERGSWGYDWHTHLPSFPHLHSSFGNYALPNPNNYAIGKTEHRTVELYMYRGSEWGPTLPLCARIIISDATHIGGRIKYWCIPEVARILQYHSAAVDIWNSRTKEWDKHVPGQAYSLSPLPPTIGETMLILRVSNHDDNDLNLGLSELVCQDWVRRTRAGQNVGALPPILFDIPRPIPDMLVPLWVDMMSYWPETGPGPAWSGIPSMDHHHSTISNLVALYPTVFM